jgi:hypothetical protein
MGKLHLEASRSLYMIPLSNKMKFKLASSIAVQQAKISSGAIGFRIKQQLEQANV